jgi:hypothetical protein
MPRVLGGQQIRRRAVSRAGARSGPEAAVAIENGELVIRVRLDAQAADELVRLADVDLEAKAKARLVRDGSLKVVRIGRELFTKRSYLLALVDELPAHRPADVAEPEAEELRSDLEIAVARASKRRGRRAA